MRINDEGKTGMEKCWRAAVLAVALCAATVLPAHLAQPARAQDATTPSVNLSKSGSASLPAIGMAPSGRLHALWWDQLDGTRYARGEVAVTQTTWSNSVVVPAIIGQRLVNQETNQVTLQPPAGLQMQVDAAGAAHAIWFDARGQLLYSQAGAGANASWAAPSVLAAGAAGVAMTLDISGTLRIAFIQTSSTPQSPAGVYYLARAGNALRRTLAFPSTYFRTARPEEVSISLASDGSNAVIAWLQTREGNSFAVRTADGGATWSVPEPVAPRGEGVGIPVKVVVGSEGAGRFLLMWRDASAPGCGLFQKNSADAGQTWSTPQRTLTSLIRCPEGWQMAFVGEGQMALLGLPSATPTPDVQTGMLAFWNGGVWSQPADVTLLYQDANTQSVRVAGCLNLALAGSRLATVGCDPRGDVWADVRPVDPSAAVAAGAAQWAGSQLLTSEVADNGVMPVRNVQDVSMASDANGNAFAAWAVSAEPGQPATTLQISSLNAGQWTRPQNIFNIAEVNAGAQNGAALTQVAQPSMAAGNDGKLHVVWSGGESGRVFYSAAFTRDAMDESRWRAPAMLPAPSPIGSSPQIHASLETGRLSVLFTVPFNEGRGVYLTQSSDGGATWLTPTQVFDAMAAGWDAVGYSRLAVDAEGGIFHAVWMKTPLPGAGGARELFYARSDDGGRAWSQPLRIDEGQIEQPQLLVIGQNSLLMTWQKRVSSDETSEAPMQMWWQASPFGGERWTPPALLNGFDRISGEPGVTADGAGRVYVAALGQGVSGEASLLYSEWRGNAWSAPEMTSLSQPAAAGNSAFLAVLNNAQQLQGLMRVSTVRQDGQREFGILTTQRQVEAAAVQPLPTFTPMPSRAEETPVAVVALETIAPTPMTVSNTAPTGSGDMATTLLLGAGLALVVLTAGIAISFILARRR
jgi:hypothetical protein